MRLIRARKAGSLSSEQEAASDADPLTLSCGHSHAAEEEDPPEGVQVEPDEEPQQSPPGAYQRVRTRRQQPRQQQQQQHGVPRDQPHTSLERDDDRAPRTPDREEEEQREEGLRREVEEGLRREVEEDQRRADAAQGGEEESSTDRLIVAIMTRMTQPGNFGECASVTGRVQPEEIEVEDVDEPGKHRMDDAQKETRKKEERERRNYIDRTTKRRKMDVDPGPVCQQCHGLIDSPVVVNLCPLCKVDLHTDCLDVHFLLDHQISFERWNKSTLEAQEAASDADTLTLSCGHATTGVRSSRPTQALDLEAHSEPAALEKAVGEVKKEVTKDQEGRVSVSTQLVLEFVRLAAGSDNYVACCKRLFTLVKSAREGLRPDWACRRLMVLMKIARPRDIVLKQFVERELHRFPAWFCEAKDDSCPFAAYVRALSSAKKELE